jgi:hypothetical protein
MSIVDHMTRDDLLRMQQSARLYQERYQRAVDPWDQQIKGPILGQSVDDYRRDTLVKLKKLLPENHELRIPVRTLRNDALDILEPQILQAVRAEAHNPSTVPPGEFRRVVRVDSNGMKIVEWIGPQSFVKDMGRPGRRIKSVHWLTDHQGRRM